MAKRRAASRGTSRAATRKGARAAKAVTRTKKRAKSPVKKVRAGVKKTKKKAPKRAAGRKTAAVRKPAAKKSLSKKTAAKKVVRRASKAPAVKATAPKTAARKKAARKAPALNRERRMVQEDDLSGAPSSLDFDRTASSARSGRQELADRISRHNESSPAMTAGDVDADWEGAYSSGDEAPGGDNPTPDQDIVDEIGRAVGVEYDDDEELQGADKIAERDAHRWELDPDSAEDDDRD